MPYTVNSSDEFDNWFNGLKEDLQDEIAFAVGLLQERGYQLS